MNTLIQEFGGQTIRIPKTNMLMVIRRNMAILKDFEDGYEIKKIAAKWNLTSGRIRVIIKDTKNARDNPERSTLP